MAELMMICVLSGTGFFYQSDTGIIFQAKACDSPGQVQEWRMPKDSIAPEQASEAEGLRV